MDQRETIISWTEGKPPLTFDDLRAGEFFVWSHKPRSLRLKGDDGRYICIAEGYIHKASSVVGAPCRSHSPVYRVIVNLNANVQN